MLSMILERVVILCISRNLKCIFVYQYNAICLKYALHLNRYAWEARLWRWINKLILNIRNNIYMPCKIQLSSLSLQLNRSINSNFLWHLTNASFGMMKNDQQYHFVFAVKAMHSSELYGTVMRH